MLEELRCRGMRQQQQRLSQGDNDQQDGSYQQDAESQLGKLADDGAAHIDGPVFMARIRSCAACIAADMHETAGAEPSRHSCSCGRQLRQEQRSTSRNVGCSSRTRAVPKVRLRPCRIGPEVAAATCCPVQAQAWVTRPEGIPAHPALPARPGAPAEFNRTM